MHSAPLRVDSRGYLVAVDAATQEKLDGHNPKQVDKRHGQDQQVKKKLTAMYSRTLAVPKGVASSATENKVRIATKPGEYSNAAREELQEGEVADREHLCRGLITLDAVYHGLVHSRPAGFL